MREVVIGGKRAPCTCMITTAGQMWCCARELQDCRRRTAASAAGEGGPQDDWF